jgi:hypothetical protein
LNLFIAIKRWDRRKVEWLSWPILIIEPPTTVRAIANVDGIERTRADAQEQRPDTSGRFRYRFPKRYLHSNSNTVRLEPPELATPFHADGSPKGMPRPIPAVTPLFSTTVCI